MAGGSNVVAYREVLSKTAVAISISESSDMAQLGLGEGHLRDAMSEVARHLLALGARLFYGGDLRSQGFAELLFELVARHRRDSDEGDDLASVTNLLAWPVHIQKTHEELRKFSQDLSGAAKLEFLGLNGNRLSWAQRIELQQQIPDKREWEEGLTSMRKSMRDRTQARIVLGGRTDNFQGRMPGIAEETFLALQIKQPVFVLGGFGGCARDVAESLGISPADKKAEDQWPFRNLFKEFDYGTLNNCLSIEENRTLALTPHIDQAISIVLRGLIKITQQ